MILLDTHALIWFVEGNSVLRPLVRSTIEASADDGEALVSVISLLEIGMLVAKNRVQLSEEIADWTRKVLSAPGVSLAALTPEIAIGSAFMPVGMHADPADRLLVATARALDATLVTHDRRILRYGEAGHLKVLAA